MVKRRASRGTLLFLDAPLDNPFGRTLGPPLPQQKPGRIQTPTNKSVASRYPDCPESHQNLCQERPSSSINAIPGTGPGENRRKLHSATELTSWGDGDWAIPGEREVYRRGDGRGGRDGHQNGQLAC